MKFILKFPQFCVQRSAKWRAVNLFPLLNVIDLKVIRIQLGNWWRDDSIFMFLRQSWKPLFPYSLVDHTAT